MNFFEHQDEARRQTKWLVLLFLASVVSLIILTDIFIVIIVAYQSNLDLLSPEVSYKDILPLKTHLIIAGGITGAVLLACLYRFFQLKQGGFVVANALGAQYVSPSTTDPDERKLLNVVEEMAIASGTPIPSVYLLDDSAINAFAAGYSAQDAVIGMTKGAIQLLNREELQGVIAHEFSHILNGDMRLNIKLIGIIYGITFISLIGRNLLRGSSNFGHRSRGDGAAILLIVGFGLMILGSIGMFFGNMIKAAVSRQREYLADASAVQFTRNPESIGGALKKIGGWPVGSVLVANNSAEFSHFYIASGISNFAAGFFKTHPPLDDRIKRIDPRWDGVFPEVKRPEKKFSEAVSDSKAEGLKPSSIITAAAITEAITNIGNPNKSHVEYAHNILEQIPGELLEAAHEPHSAYTLALGLTLSENTSDWKSQVKHLDSKADFRVVEKLDAMLPSLAALHTQHRLPLIEICLSSLKALDKEKKSEFKRDMKLIIHEDGKLELWEWVLYRLFTLAFELPNRANPRYSKIIHLEKECQILLAAIAYSGNKKKELSKNAFFEATSKLGLGTELPNKKQVNGAQLTKAIDKLRLLKPLEKPRLLKAFCAAAQLDGNIHYREVELIRMIAEGIDCPMPPILSN